MAVLGYDTQGASFLLSSSGRKISSKFTLGTAQTLQELHAWVKPDSGGNRWVIHIYADSGGFPGARVAYTSPIGPYSSPSTGREISQTGFSVPLAAGSYWLGVGFESSGGDGGVYNDFSATCLGILGGATFSPPSDPYGGTDHSSTRNISAWAVVGAAPSGTTYTKASYAAVGLIGAGDFVATYTETRYATVGLVGSGAKSLVIGATYTKTAYAVTGLVGRGTKVFSGVAVYTKASYATIAGVGSGRAARPTVSAGMPPATVHVFTLTPNPADMFALTPHPVPVG